MRLWRSCKVLRVDDLQKVLPAVDADMNDSSKDGEFVKYDGASVLLNHVALNKTVKHRIRLHIRQMTCPIVCASISTTPIRMTHRRR